MSVHSRYRAGLWHPYEKPMYGVLLNTRHPLARGLVGCWLFNEGGGNTVFDLSDNFKHGTFGAEAPSWVAEGIYFGGDGDYIYTDPPYGKKIPYLDLSVMWNAWLDLEVTEEDYKLEAIEGGEMQKEKEEYFCRGL